MMITYQFNASKENACGIQAKINPKIQSLDGILEACSKQTCCVFWFIGTKDLTQGSLDLLCSNKRKRLYKLLEKGTEVYLTDLMAWKAFEEKVNPISCKSKFEPLICSLREKGIAYLGSNRFFNKLFAIDKPEIIAWINQILQRESLYVASQDQANNGRMLSDLVEGDFIPQVFQAIAWLDKPLSQLYSVFQYIEIFFYIEDIIRDQLSRSILDQDLSFNIQFVLPNDEYRYYLNDPNNIEASNAAFQQDVKTFLQFVGLDEKIQSLGISIACFNFYQTKNLKARPYNSGAVISQEAGELQLSSLGNQTNTKRITGRI